jgi:hypothetical protein
MGHNLLSLHGLYYSTHGSWWEWAAPDNHWRQPYWANMSDFLKCSERLSYILSQGYHRCDVAMVYPVAPTEANLKGEESTETAFKLAENLYPSGTDFDFMDFESLNCCKVQNKELQVSGEKYKVLILPSLSAVRYSNIEKALEFYRSGGIVMAVGSLPEASERIGGNDEKLQAMIKEIFGTTYSERHDSTKIYSQKSKTGGIGLFIHSPLQVKKEIDQLIQLDFKTFSEGVTSNILHRKLGERDLYFVYGVPKGTSCFFRSKGKVELWNPWDGTVKPLEVSSVSETGTTIQLPLEKSEPQLIVFSPGIAEIEKPEADMKSKTETLRLDNDWEFELKPTLDNKYGDYRLPAFDGKLGVEVWKMKYAKEIASSQDWQSPAFDDSKWATEMVSYGQQFWKLGPLPDHADFNAIESRLSTLEKVNPDEPLEIDGLKYVWTPYEFSWRWGLKDDAGHQGYHGLKGKVNNELISFGKIDKSNKSTPVFPMIAEKDGSVYYLWSTVSAPKQMQAKISKEGLLPTKVYLNHVLIQNRQDLVELKSGSNPVLLKYNAVGRGYFVFQDNQLNSEWEQSVSLATDWYLNPSVLAYNCFPQSKGEFGWYRFAAPPGTRSMIFQATAKPKVWIAGVEALVMQTESKRFVDTKILAWKIDFPNDLLTSSVVALKIEQTAGYFGGAAIPEPVLFECSKGKIQLGNLNENESLKTYSGGMWYRKRIRFAPEQLKSDQIILDLGKLVASAEVFVNGKSVGSKVSSPWKFDLAGKVQSGENLIEILVFNTLGNHYLTTPSMYVGRTNSGLIGPVKIEFHEIQH